MFSVEDSKLLCLVFTLILFTNIVPLELYKFIGLVPYFLFIKLFGVNGKCVSLSCLFGLFLLFLQHIVPDIKSTFLSELLNIQSYVGNLTKKLYGREISEFVNLFLFNIKNSKLFRIFSDLGIVYLISVSGFHFYVLARIFEKLFKNKGIILIFLVIYGSCIGFSIPGLRVILLNMFSRYKFFKKGSICVLVSLFFNLHIYGIVSFWISYFLPLLFVINTRLFKNRFNLHLANLGTAFLFSSLVFMGINKKINVFQIINVFIFSPLVCCCFIFLFFTGFFPLVKPVYEILFSFFKNINKLFSFNSLIVTVFDGNISYSAVLLSVFAFVFLLFVYKKNKEDIG